jgi:hypothetical protein
VFAAGGDVLDVVRAGADRTFPSVTTFATPGFGALNSVAVSDFDGDGVPDLLQTSGAGTATLSHGIGDRTFADSVELDPGGAATASAAADVDGDGHQDVVVAGEGHVWTLRGNGKGDFRALAPAQDDTQARAPDALLLADLDRDGKLDVVTNEGSVLLGHGDGTFDTAIANGPAGGDAWSDVADLDGDGVLDLALTNRGAGVVNILHGRGDGTFDAAVSMPVIGTPNGIAAADLDGDGLAELLVAIPEAKALAVFPNLGGGAFGARADYPAGSGAFRVIKARLSSAEAQPSFVVLDTYSGTISAYLGNGHGGLYPRSLYGAGLLPRDVAIADLDGDHLPDLTIAGPLHGEVLAGACLP